MTGQPQIYLSLGSPADYQCLADIQVAAFLCANNPHTVAVWSDVSAEEYSAWLTEFSSRVRPPPGHKILYVCARQLKDDDSAVNHEKIVGFARWVVPLRDDEEDEDQAKPPVPPLPKGAKSDVRDDFRRAIGAAEKRIMGDRKYWSLAALAVDPLYERQGIGRALVSWGIERAAADGLPIYLEATPSGEPLYRAMGFELKGRELVGEHKLPATYMLLETAQ